MSSQYKFGDLELDPLTGELVSGSGRTTLPPKVFGVLHYLIEHRDRIVSVDELLEVVWPDAVVAQDSVHQAIRRIRRALKDQSGLLVTVPRRGYRFNGEVIAATSEPGAASGPIFVGRERELGLLEARLQNSLSGQAELTVLHGPAGIGKTSTARKFLERAETQGAWTAVGSCLEGQGAFPYRPWLQILRALERQHGPGTLRAVFGESARDVAAALPELSGILAIPRGARPLSDPWVHARFFDAVVECLRDLASDQPLVVMIDDLQRGDRDSLGLLAFVVEQISDVPLLVLVTTRDTQPEDSEAAALIDRILRHRPEGCVELSGLDRADVSNMLELSGHDSGALDVVQLVDQTGGNPLFLQQWLRSGADFADLPAISARGLQASLERMLEGAASSTRVLLEMAAVIGREFPVVLLAPALGFSRTTTDRAIAEAVRLRLLERQPLDQSTHRFVHGLIPELIEASIPRDELPQRHAQITRALESAHGSTPSDEALALLAVHGLAACWVIGVDVAVAHVLRAARVARDSLAHDEALRLCDGAIDVVKRNAVFGVEYANCLIEKGETELASGRYADAQKSFVAAARLAVTHNRTDLLVVAVLGPSRLDETGEIDREQVRLLELALTRLGEGGVAGTRARLMGELGKAIYFEDHDRAVGLTGQAVKIAQSLGDNVLLATILRTRHFSLCRPEFSEERRIVAAEQLRVSRLQEDPFLEAAALRTAVSDALRRGDRADLDLRIRQHAQLAQRHGLGFFLWYAKIHQGMLAQMEGRFREGLELAEQTLKMGHRVQPEIAIQWYGVQRLNYELEVGDAAPLRSQVADLVERFPAISSWQAVLALVDLQSGQEEGAMAVMRRLTADGFSNIPRDLNYEITLINFVRVAHLLDDQDAARALRALLLECEDHFLCVGLAAGGQGAMSRYLGLCAELTGDFETAVSDLRSGIETDECMGARPFVARGQLDLARILGKWGRHTDRNEIATLIGRVKNEAEAMGISTLLKTAKDLERLERTSALTR